MNDQDFPALYILGTPIGNLGDFSTRARATLEQVDWIAAEDTRETRKLLHHLGITKDLISFHEHSSAEKCSELVDRIKQGQSGAYVSDAGTPGVSDPGADLVDAAFKAGVKIVPIPGASALTTLLSVCSFSGAPTIFYGFLPRDGLAEFWQAASASPGVHVFFESPHRVEKSLAALATILPEARIVMGRELTKHFEEIYRGSVNELLASLSARKDTEKRGEFVFALEIGARAADSVDEHAEKQKREFFQELAALGANQKLLVRVGEEMGWPRNTAYRLALAALGK